MAKIAAKKLGLSAADLPNSIKEVIATLTRAGFEAYIVGGGVRDTLLGMHPKDFDAVTNAKPHEVKQVFGKRCRIIGRRFQLAHVFSGRDMIEVATFRAPPSTKSSISQTGMVVRDNVWGNIKQDYIRRDFTINALYWQPQTGIVQDFCNALKDIQTKKLRLLGNANVRMEEDPVRLLRALRFKAKLGFEFDTTLASEFNAKNWALLDQVSPHRLYDESQKMFTGGYLQPLLPLLFEYNAISHLMVYPPDEITPFIAKVATNTDARINIGKSINPAFFYAALLWHNYLYQLDKLQQKYHLPFVEASHQAGIKVVNTQRLKTAIPKFAEQFIRDIWQLQFQLTQPKIKNLHAMPQFARFRAGFDFLLLREQTGDTTTAGMGQWWADYQSCASNVEREKMIRDYHRSLQRKRHKQTTTPLNAETTTADLTTEQHHECDINQRTRTQQQSNTITSTNHQTMLAIELVLPLSDKIPNQRRWRTPKQALTVHGK